MKLKHNKRLKRDCQRAAFLVCGKFCSEFAVR
ncbi:DUF3265 domain-containing protein [Vibrio cholerae]